MKIQVDSEGNVKNMDALFTKFYKGVQNAAREIARQHANNLRIELMKHTYTGVTGKSVQMRTVDDDHYVVKMAQSGIWLSTMKPHGVWAGKGRPIRMWAFMKGSTRIQNIASRQGFIGVHPDPFMQRAEDKTIGKDLKRILENEIRIAMG
jgi:hypothetical protein